MMPLIDHLQFYECTDVLVELCRKTYTPVARSSEIMGGTERELADIVFVDMIDKVYRLILSGEPVDWEAFTRQAKKYGFIGSQEMADEIRDHLTKEMEGGETFAADFRRNREESLDTVVWAFDRYMLDRKGMDFICSHRIMGTVWEFLRERKLRGQKSVSPNAYFAFAKGDLDSHLGQMAAGFLSTRQAEAVGLLWGIVYVYDFLLSKDIIAGSVHRDVIRSVNSLKTRLMKGFGSTLWQYDFVHRWTPPDSVSDADFAAESERFSKTIEMEVPLSDKPGDGSMDPFIKQLMGDMDDRELFSDSIAPDDSPKAPAPKRKTTGKKKRSGKPSAKKKKKKKRKR